MVETKIMVTITIVEVTEVMAKTIMQVMIAGFYVEDLQCK